MLAQHLGAGEHPHAGPLVVGHPGRSHLVVPTDHGWAPGGPAFPQPGIELEQPEAQPGQLAAQQLALDLERPLVQFPQPPVQHRQP